MPAAGAEPTEVWSTCDDWSVFPTQDGHFVVDYKDKRYRLKPQELEGFLASLGMKMVMEALASEPNRAYIYHNASEANVTWPVRRKRK